MANRKTRGRPVRAESTARPRITAAAATLVTDVDRIRKRIVKLAKKLDVPLATVAADTPSSVTITSALAGASASVASIHDILNHIDEAI